MNERATTPVARRVWAAEALADQTPLDLLLAHFRAHYHLESLALHNPDLDLDLPAVQLRTAQVVYHTTGVDLNWGDRSFWKNKELFVAVESVLMNFSPTAFEFFEIRTPVPPLRAVLPPQGEDLEWRVLPGHIDFRNDPSHEFNAGRSEEQIGDWETQVLREEYSPSFGKFSVVDRRETGTSLVFEIEEQPDGTRRVHSPIVAAVRQGRSFLVDPLGDRNSFPEQ